MLQLGFGAATSCRSNGGDYYDWQPLPDGKILLALADVTGHGIGPALLAAVCRAYARTNFAADNGLLSAMTRINASLSADLREGRFVTFVAAICTPGKSGVELLSAGHGPLFLYMLNVIGSEPWTRKDCHWECRPV